MTMHEPITTNRFEDERWLNHSKAHARDQEVADKAAKDVKEALDKAAIEVTGRLTEVRAYIDQVLTSHADLHAADREALLLARAGLEKELLEINNVREQIAAERSLYTTGDYVRTLLQGMKQEISAILTASEVDMRSDLTMLRETQKDDIKRIAAIEISASNLNGRLAAFGAVLLAGIGVIEFVLRH